MNDAARNRLNDSVNTTHALVQLAAHERAVAGYDTLTAAKARLEKALVARRNAAEALAKYDAK